MLRKILEFYFKSYYRYRLNLQDLNTEVFMADHTYSLPSGFSFKILEASDISYFMNGHYTEEQIRSKKARLADPEHRKCFAIIDGSTDRLAYSCWTNSLANYYHREFESTYHHNGSTVLFETDFTEPDYRRLGLHSYCMMQRILHSKQAGFKQVVINIHIHNTPALRTVENFGFTKTFRIPLALRKGSLKYTFNRLFGKR